MYPFPQDIFCVVISFTVETSHTLFVLDTPSVYIALLQLGSHQAADS